MNIAGFSHNSWPIPRVYATWNPLDKSANVTLSGGNLTATRAGQGTARTTQAIAGSMKPYWEITLISSTGVYDIYVGLATFVASLSAIPGNPDTNCWAIALDDGTYYHGGFIGTASTSWPAITNDVFGFAYDAGAQTLIISRNGTNLTPNPLFTGITGTVYPIIFFQSQTAVITANFGASAFTGTVPGGYNSGLYTN